MVQELDPCLITAQEKTLSHVFDAHASGEPPPNFEDLEVFQPDPELQKLPPASPKPQSWQLRTLSHDPKAHHPDVREQA